MTLTLAREGRLITSVESWFAIAPPRGGEKHWVDGRSAKELAKAWCRRGSPAVPVEVASLLQSHPDIGDLDFFAGEPEARVAFDSAQGEPRNADLVLAARDRTGLVAISVEAKADEPFDRYIGDVLVSALERQLANPRSEGVERVRQLVASLLASGTPVPLGRIRYQLLTAAAGAIAWAKRVGAARAVLLVHEFRSPESNRIAVRQNGRDLRNFARKLAGSEDLEVQDGLLLGPFRVPGSPLFDKEIALYLGKVITEVQGRTTSGAALDLWSSTRSSLSAFACPVPPKWARIHGELRRSWEGTGGVGDPPPEPLILGAWGFTSTAEKHQRWLALLDWAEERGLWFKIPEVSPQERVALDQYTGSADYWPFGFPYHANTTPRPVHSPEAVHGALERLCAEWSLIAGSIASVSVPIALAGQKSRRLVVAADYSVDPPWGSWTSLAADDRRKTFSELRRRCNDVLSPLEVDHIDFVPMKPRAGSDE